MKTRPVNKTTIFNNLNVLAIVYFTLILSMNLPSLLMTSVNIFLSVLFVIQSLVIIRIFITLNAYVVNGTNRDSIEFTFENMYRAPRYKIDEMKFKNTLATLLKFGIVLFALYLELYYISIPATILLLLDMFFHNYHDNVYRSYINHRSYY